MTDQFTEAVDKGLAAGDDGLKATTDALAALQKLAKSSRSPALTTAIRSVQAAKEAVGRGYDAAVSCGVFGAPKPQGRVLAAGEIALDASQAFAVRRALFIGLSCLGEIQKVRDAADCESLCGRPLAQRLVPALPPTDVDAVALIGDALWSVEGREP